MLYLLLVIYVQSLLITLIVGLFFFMGSLISLFIKKKKELISFSIGMSIIIMISLVFMDILPECLELFSGYKIISISGGILVGIGILMLLDKLIPHHHDHDDAEDHNHLAHIGVMTSLALILHNIVEGIGIAVIAKADIKTGLIYALGVSLHNIPFGIKITTMLNDNKNKKKMWIYIILLTSSTFAGGLIMFTFSSVLSDFVLGTLLSITIGMIIYIVFFELFSELKESFNKYSFFGILTGILLMLIGLVI